MKILKTALIEYFGRDNVIYLKEEHLKSLAEKLNRAAINPETFCMYIERYKAPGPLYSNIVGSDKFWGDFMEFIKYYPDQAKLHAKLELECIKTEMGIAKSPLDVIHSKTLNLSPLIRFIICGFLKMPEEGQRYEGGACKMAIESPWYVEELETLKDYFPECIRHG